MAPQASKKCSLLPPDHHRIGCYTTNSLNSEQVSGSFSMLTILSLSPQTSARSEQRFLTPLPSQDSLPSLPFGIPTRMH